MHSAHSDMQSANKVHLYACVRLGGDDGNSTSMGIQCVKLNKIDCEKYVSILRQVEFELHSL